MRRAAVLATAAVLLISPAAASAQDADPGAAATGPNVVVVMTDDQRYDDMATLPATRRLVGNAGVTFSRAYVSYPVCCPARATFFTGQYAHNHGVRCLHPPCGGYTALRQGSYLPVWLERAGYVTGHIGKFLNGYGKDARPDKPNGWTEWFGLIDHTTYRMWGYDIFENDHRVTYGRVMRERRDLYQTDKLTEKAVEFIDEYSGGGAPFFLSVAYLAPHHESGRTQERTGKLVRPAPRHRGRYANWPLPKPRGFNEGDMSDKPRFVAQRNRVITPRREAAITKRFRERWESLLAVDEGVERIVKALRNSRELDNTYVIFTSDHGFMQGEHRIPQGKMVPYDPSTHVPLLIRGPGLPRGRTSGALVGDVDFAPTVLDATPATTRRPLDGRSILPFARRPSRKSHRPFLHTTAGQGAKGRTNTREGGARGTQPRVPAWRGIRTTGWLYVEYVGGQTELFNMRRDPWQVDSVARDPRRRTLRNTMRRLLGDLENCDGRACGRAADPSVR